MKKRPKVTSDPTPLRSNPFSKLASLRPELPAAPPSATDAALPPGPRAGPVSPRSEPDLAHCPKLVVRRQKKGQGGKTATFVEGLSPSVANAVLPRIKRALGCGGRVEGSTLVLGTKQHAAVATWLSTAGAAQVVVGN